jgi:peptide/nickel transport system substrate-binding protein
MLALGPLVTACGGEGSGVSGSASPSGSAAGQPVKGGHLRAAAVGGSSKDSLDPGVITGEAEIAVTHQLYDALYARTPDQQFVPNLAEELAPNAEGTVWTARLRDGVEFHNGKTMTADDVVYTFQRIVDPKAPMGAASMLVDLKPGNIKKVDKLTVEFTFDKPNVVFTEMVSGVDSRTAIVPVDFDPATGIGTGPFKLEDYRPGEVATFSPNPNYFGKGPWVDKATIVNLLDPAARVNALLGGTVDAMADLPMGQVAIIESNPTLKVLDSDTGGWLALCMRLDQKPFNDPRVVEAVQYMVDRPAVIEQAYNGFSSLANDMYTRYDPGIPTELPQREQDLERAKSLLKAAGYADFKIDLNTSEGVGAGAVELAQVFAEQAKAVGWAVNVKKQDIGMLWGEYYTKWLFSVSRWNTHNFIVMAGMVSSPAASWNETHWKNDEWAGLFAEATKTVDDTKRNEIIKECLTIQQKYDGWVIPGWRHQVDAYSTKLGGVRTDGYGAPLGKWCLNEMYFV